MYKQPNKRIQKKEKKRKTKYITAIPIHRKGHAYILTRARVSDERNKKS